MSASDNPASTESHSHIRDPEPVYNIDEETRMSMGPDTSNDAITSTAADDAQPSKKGQESELIL